jgi:hypothetical protein
MSFTPADKNSLEPSRDSISRIVTQIQRADSKATAQL